MAEKLIVIGGTAAGLSAASRARKENLTWRFKSLKIRICQLWSLRSSLFCRRTHS